MVCRRTLLLPWTSYTPVFSQCTFFWIQYSLLPSVTIFILTVSYSVIPGVPSSFLLKLIDSLLYFSYLLLYISLIRLSIKFWQHRRYRGHLTRRHDSVTRVKVSFSGMSLSTNRPSYIVIYKQLTLDRTF